MVGRFLEIHMDGNAAAASKRPHPTLEQARRKERAAREQLAEQAMLNQQVTGLSSKVYAKAA